MLNDTKAKFANWKSQESVQKLHAVACDLRDKGVCESRLVSDTSLQLGDDASCVKMIYSVLSRWDLVLVLGVDSGILDLDELSSRLGNLEDWDLEKLQSQLQQMLQADPFLSDNASKAWPYVCLKDPAAIFSECLVPEAIKEAEDLLVERFKHVKAVVAATRKSFKDMMRC